jgi:RNA polymerase sigma-70 factor (ECF subfamily)
LIKISLRRKALSGDALDVHLMLQVASGSEEAFRQLIARHEGALLNLFRRLGADQDEADDVAQETFLRLFGYRERYRPEARFRTFLFTVARHAWLDYCRKRERWRRSDGPIPEEELAQESCRVSTSERMDLEAALRQLPVAHRMVLVLSAYEGLSYAEIGRIMEIPEGTVKSRVFHGLRKLRTELGVDVELSRR